MGYKCSFLDNESYDAADVSHAFSRLTTEGVLPYPQTDTVIDALDTLTAELTSEGVTQFGGLAVTVADGAVKIGEGSAIFQSGVAIDVDEEGISAERGTGEVYVALVYEEALNRVTPYVGQTAATGDCVPLAKIGEDDTVVDMRIYAKTKLIPNSANVYHEFDMSFDGFGSSTNVAAATKSYKMPHTDYKYLIIRGFENPGIDYYLRGEVADISGTEHTVIYLSRSSNNHRIEIWREGDTLKLTPLAAVHAGTMTFHLVLV